MKRFMFALGMLATVAVSSSDAGYIVIRIVLEGSSSGSGGAEDPGNPAWALNGGYRGGRSLGGGPPSPGQPPGPSMSGPGPGSGSAPPKGGSGGGPPPGLGGASGNSPPGLGQPPPGGLTGGGPGPQGSGKSDHPVGSVGDPTKSIYVVVPYTNDITKEYSFYKREKLPLGSTNPHWRPAIKHPFGYANLIDDNTQIQLYLDLGPLAPKGLKTRQSDLTERHARWLRNTSDSQMLLDMANTALEQGFVAEAFKYSDELLTSVQDAKARNTPQVDSFVKAYTQVKDAMSRPAKGASDGPLWRERISFAYPGVKDYLTPHYHVLFWEGMDPEATRRAAQLEENYKAFYLMNAIRGNVLPVPEKPQIVVLAKTTQDVFKLWRSLDGLSQVSDGFFCPDHGIVVLAPERLDGIGHTFKRQIQDMFRQGITRSMLLAGEGPKVDERGELKDSRKPDDVARMMTWVVVERYAEEESEWSAVSREGTRQLLYSIGILPQHVALPLWLAEGSASYYQRPRGPVFTHKDDRDYVTVSLSTGYGVPNYVRQKQFSELVRLRQFTPQPAKKGEPAPKADPGQILRNVITDSYFTAALSGLDADNPLLPLPVAKGKTPPAETPEAIKRKRNEFLIAKAQSTSWALYFYLANANPTGLTQYLSELGRQPRDLPLDESARVATFARAFNLTFESKAAEGKQTFSDLGAAWLQYMENVPVPGIDLPLTELAATTGPAGAPGAGGPGAPPPVGKPGTGK